jgi:F-type H+-transporting ATPase subunit b
MKRDKWRKEERLSGVIRAGVSGILAMLLMAGSVWASSSGHEEAAHASQEFVATDGFRIMCFVVLLVALVVIIRKWVAPLFSGRIQGIKDELDDLETRKKEAEEKLAHYDKRLAEMEKEAETIVESYIEQGKEAQARIIEQAKASAEKLEAHAQRQIENAIQRAREEVQEAIIEKAMAKAEALIRENISAEDQTKLVDEYLEKVVA